MPRQSPRRTDDPSVGGLSVALVVSNVISANRDVDALLMDYRWKSGQVLRFGFPILGGEAWGGYGAQLGYSAFEPYTNFAALNAAHQAVVTSILASVERLVAGISFVNVASVGEAPDSADLRFGMTDETEAAHAYTPFPDFTGGDTGHLLSGDVWFNNSEGYFTAPVVGDYAYSATLHEIGHALG